MGADLTCRLTSDLTLTATLDPDFGQVEVDPAVVNLSAFETFFPEKREFFVADRGRFDVGSFWCSFCSNASSLSLLFTRRIGRSPQAAGLAHGAGEYADVPAHTTILGAAKVTGRTAGGTSLGVMAAATGRETTGVLTADGVRLPAGPPGQGRPEVGDRPAPCCSSSGRRIGAPGRLSSTSASAGTSGISSPRRGTTCSW